LEDLASWADRALELARGYSEVDFVDVRIQRYDFEEVVADNGRLRESTVIQRTGLGVRVVIEGRQGYSSTSVFSSADIRRALEDAIRAAKSLVKARRASLAEYSFRRDRRVSHYRVDPLAVDHSEKVKLVMDLNKSSMIKGVSSSVTRLGIQRDWRLIANTEGAWVEVDVRMVGVSQASIAREAGVLETVTDRDSRVAGWEYIESRFDDLRSMAVEASKLAVEAVRAKHPKPGSYDVVLEPEVIGLFLHEALGHASEADLVLAGSSVLRGRLGEKIAPDYVTIVDDGLVEGGYFVPYDDEGVEKVVVKVVDRGVLRGFLTSRSTSSELGLKPTGNARAMDYSNPLLVRQTNYYMLPGDYKPEELISEARQGIYVTAKGARGGEVNPAVGTFTFNVGVSWLIEGGEKTRILRGVNLSGSILDVLANIVAVGRDLKVTTSVFGGCGKGGQLVRVGDGGPHVLVRSLTVGGVG